MQGKKKGEEARERQRENRFKETTKNMTHLYFAEIPSLSLFFSVSVSLFLCLRLIVSLSLLINQTTDWKHQPLKFASIIFANNAPRETYAPAINPWIA